MAATTHRSTAVIVTIIVAANMLALAATDLYLPSVPHLPELIGISVEEAQYTLVAFSAGFAISQILFGALGDLYSRRLVLTGAMVLFLPASMACAMAETAEALIGARFLQGFSASAAAALAAPMIRELYAPERAVHALSVIGGIDALIPAFAPILGAAVFAQFGWEANFWLIAIVALPVLAGTAFFLPDNAPAGGRFWPTVAGYGRLFRDRQYMAYAVSHSLAFGGMMTLVLSAPVLIVNYLGGHVTQFVYCQIMWVGAFLAATQVTGYLARKLGAARLVRLGTASQIAGSLSIAAVLAVPEPDWFILALSALPLMAGIGLRGGAGFALAMDAVPTHAARASSLLIAFAMMFSAIGAGSVAPFLGQGLAPVAAALVTLCLASRLVLAARRD